MSEKIDLGDGVALTFGEGTVLPDDVYTWHATPPVWTEPIKYKAALDLNRHDRRARASRNRRRGVASPADHAYRGSLAPAVKVTL